MKNKNKGKVQYVEQFRKITAIEKLPTLKQGFGDIFFQNKAENNKFLRLKDEPYLNQTQLNYRISDLCHNQYVAQYVYDDEQLTKNQIQNYIHILNDQIQNYKNWAKELTDYVEKGVYSYVFKGQKASPPVALTDQMKKFDPITVEINNDTKNKSKNNKNKIVEQSVNIPKNFKRFDFNEITDYFMNDDFKQEDLDGNIDLAKKEFEVFRQFKKIHQINQIEQLKADYEKFQYHAIQIIQTNQRKSILRDSDNLSAMGFKSNNNTSFSADQEQPSTTVPKKALPLPEILKPIGTLQQKFKYLSLHQNQLQMNINYFRNLGPPSRNIEDFIKNIALSDDHVQNLLDEDEQNPFLREKIDTCLLHFLEPKELKVDKSSLDFYDIENIAMGRVTSANSHMVIRSEKVTRLQYEKLLKKTDKLYKMQHEDGKTRVEIGISTDQVDEDPTSIRFKNQNNQNRLSLQKIVEEINAIRKEAYALETKSCKDVNYKFITPSLVKNEMSKKMFSLLEELYKRVSQQLPFKYSILQIGLHIDEINGLAENYFETKKLVWFIMTVLEEIEKGKSVDKSISYLINKNKKDDEPKVTKYKGQKVVAKDKMGTKNLFYNNPVAASTIRDRSVDLNKNANRTPSKNIGYNKNTTPVKTSTSRSPLKSTTYQQSQNKKTGSDLKTAVKTFSPYNGSTTKKTSRY